jgi:SAM-dependent methyltransferase
MAETSRHDAWQAGDSYERYMGRWNRRLAPRFLDWLQAPEGLDWLEMGCGTGALSAAILAQGNPRSLVAIGPSDGFVSKARASLPDARAEFRVGNAEALHIEPASRDVIVSGLVLNFVPDKEKALSEMKRAARRDARIAFYVWDYPGGGMELMRAFWQAAVALDPAARELAEDRRFPFCTPDGLVDLVNRAGLAPVEVTPIEIATPFRDFEDYWQPFTLGTGPAPGYCMSLETGQRERLKDALSASLPRAADGSITLNARAWALKAAVD